MNLWVKRTGQLVSLAVALFFLSCQDDVSFLGYRNPNDKFGIQYVEIPLESSVFLTDSVRTAVVAGELARVLVGKHSETSAFGSIKTTGIAQIAKALSFTKSDTVSKWDFDSAALELRFDYYSYGTAGSTPQSFSVHEIETALDPNNARKYYSTTPTAIITPGLGSNSLSVNAATFKTQYEKANAEKDTTVLHIHLDSDFGLRLFNYVKEPVVINDVSATQVELIKRIPGLAIVPGSNNDKIVGIDLNNTLDAGSTLTRLVIYSHHNVTGKVRILIFQFYGVEYTWIEAAQTGDLTNLMSSYDEVTPDQKRYIQQGTRIITKVDMDNFYKFAAEDSVKGMIINSAELVITEFDNSDVYSPIPALSFVAMSPDQSLTNRYHKVRYVVKYDTLSNGDTTGVHLEIADTLRPRLISYKGYINDVGGLFSGISDQGSAVQLVRDGTKYNAYVTLLAQHLAFRDPADRYRYFALLPSAPSNPQKEKALNRTIFNKDNLKLRIYYTIPKQQPE